MEKILKKITDEIKNIADEMDSFLKNALKSIKLEKTLLKYDKFLEKLNVGCDAIAFKTEKESETTFCGGKLFISLDEKFVNVDFNLYFLNENEKYEKRSFSQNFEIELFDKECIEKIKNEINLNSGKIEKTVEQKTYDDLLEEVSEYSDKLILDFEKNTQLQFKNGECKIYTNENFIVADYSIDFDSKDVVKKQIFKKRFPIQQFNKKCRLNLKNEVFEISHP